MATQFIIRDAAIADLATLLKMEQKLINEERSYDKTLKPSNAFYYDFGEMLSNVNFKLVLAETDHDIIGTGYARIEKAETFLVHGKYVYLGFMYVLPHWRGKGVNKQIIETLKQWAVSQNIHEVRLDVYFENKTAISAYMKSGFANHVLEMRLSV